MIRAVSREPQKGTMHLLTTNRNPQSGGVTPLDASCTGGELMNTALRFAYADPPYIGCGHLYDHPEAHLFNDPGEHLALMAHMDANYDGWALSCHEPSLAHLAAPAADIGARIAAWVKPFAAYKANVRVAYTWEPVIWKRTAPRREADPVGRDHLSCPITLQRGLTGAKPESFARWLLVLLGWQVGDELTDLFPGTGVVARIANESRLSL